MSKTSRTFRQVCLSVVFLIAGAVTTAFAVPPGQVLKVTTEPPAFSGPCCFSFNETVAVTEPSIPVPVVRFWVHSRTRQRVEYVHIRVDCFSQRRSERWNQYLHAVRRWWGNLRA